MDEVEKLKMRTELDNVMKGGTGSKVARFVIAALSGVIPLFGGAVGGAAGAWSEKEQSDLNRLLNAWLKLQEDEMKEIGVTLMEVLCRLDQQDELVRKRLESPEYLKILKKSFRDWSAAESEGKRQLISNLLTAAASSQLCTDDVVRIFIDWIDTFSEAHFAVIRAVYRNPGSTRQEIWDIIHGESVPDNSAEADLFKLLIHDLTLGYIIRQTREVNAHGQYLKATKHPKRAGSSRTMLSPFDNDKDYELTELGKQFVHYTMQEIVPKISESSTSPDL